MQIRTIWQAQTVPQVLFAPMPALSRGLPPTPDGDPLPLDAILDMWRRVRDGMNELRTAHPELFAGRAWE